MKQIADAVYVFESTKSVRTFLIKLPDRYVIIDASVPGKGKQMIAELLASGIKPSAITDILITHHDADHIGSAAYLQQATNAKVWMHKKDLAYNMGRNKRPLFKSIIGTFMKPALPKVLGVISKSGEILPGISAVETPGHTPGHTAYLYNGILFSGDAVRVKKGGSMSLLPGILTADRPAALESRDIIQKLSLKLICPTHQAPTAILDSTEL